MPVLRYFMWVGGSLLALLLMADFYLPKQPQRTEEPHSYNIPIAAAAPPDSQAITFSGETHNFGAPPPLTVVDFTARPNDAKQPATPADTGSRPDDRRAKRQAGTAEGGKA